MLEKLAEIVREQSNSRPHYQGGIIPCFACDMRPVMSNACDKYNLCPDTGKPDGSLMLARWAVLLVAEGLGIRREGDKIVAPPSIDYQLLNLIAEANTNVSSGEEQMCKPKEAGE